MYFENRSGDSLFLAKGYIMKVLFDVNHAAHVHFIRNAYISLTKQGYDCRIAASDKPLAYKLLKEYKLPYLAMGPIGKSMFAKMFKLIIHDIKLLIYCIKHRPKLILGIVAIRGSHVGWLLGIKTIVFTDTEHAKLQIAFFKPFATEIHNPQWFTKSLGKKQVLYNGFHELAYLHPNNFNPRSDVLDKLGVAQGEEYFILRLVAWDATHDINQSGISLQYKRDIIEYLKKRGRVFITAEYPLEEEFKTDEYSLPASYLHDAIYYSSLVIGEGATTACEAALLGVPSIYINTISLGYITYLESNFDLVWHLTNATKCIEKLDQLFSKPNYRDEWQKKKKLFLDTQLDTSEYIVSLVEKYTQEEV